MAKDEDRFTPRLGRARSGKAPGAGRALQSELCRRIARAGGDHRRLAARSASARGSGRFNSRGRGARASLGAGGASPWSLDPVSGMRVRARRVMVKARVVKLPGVKAAGAARAHLRYLQRDGVTRAGEPGRLYSTFSDEADGKAFLERGEGDRHQFRFIVSPEDGASFETLRSFTRALMARMEEDLGTTLDWVAVDHFDTGHPHVHILVAGTTEDGKVLNIAGDYIAHGIRERGSQIMTGWLGPQSELEVREQLEREIGAERLTRLDRDLLARSGEGLVDLRQQAPWGGGGTYQQLLVGRARQLERMGLAERKEALVWKVAPGLETTLTDLGRRGDIIRTMHRAITLAKLERRPELYVVDAFEADPLPVVGRVIHRGAADDHHDRRFLVLDGVDGRTHYVEIGSSAEPAPVGSVVRAEPVRPGPRKADRVIDEVARANGGLYGADLHLARDPTATPGYLQAHARRLEALRRGQAGVERLPDGRWAIPPDYLERALEHGKRHARAAPVRIRMLALRALEQEAVSSAPSWLDAPLRGEAGFDIAAHGYGGEVRQALYRRQQWLIGQGLATREGERVLYRGDMDQRLRRAELRTLVAQLSRELGLEFAEALPGTRIAGICRRRLDLSSGSLALVESGRTFTLVPWRPVLEGRLGRDVSGLMRRSGAISWTFGRARPSPGLGL